VWPGGFVTASSTSKRIPQTFPRPWQSDFQPIPAKCVFETAEKRAAAILTHADLDGETWRVITSDFAPENPHWLIIPEACWPAEKMRCLGGEAKIRSAVELATRALEAHEEDRGGILAFSIQVGALAAQNQRHTHYHLYRPNLFDGGGPIGNPRPADVTLPNDPELLVFEERGFRVTAGGQYTGQLFITSMESFSFSHKGAGDLAYVLAKIVSLYIEKFRTPEGLAPDYRFEIELWEGSVHFGIFVPKLNNTGTLEDMSELDPRRPKNLAWSHAETARYLRAPL